jgi:hypothetical protein
VAEPTPTLSASVYYQCLSHGLAGTLWWQWLLLDAQFRAGLKLVAALSSGAVPPPEREPETGAPRAGEDLKEIERRVAELASKGLPPPREIYEVQNRSRIDWSRFPEWARPVDPEVFEGCGHEG